MATGTGSRERCPGISESECCGAADAAIERENSHRTACSSYLDCAEEQSWGKIEPERSIGESPSRSSSSGSDRQTSGSWIDDALDIDRQYTKLNNTAFLRFEVLTQPKLKLMVVRIYVLLSLSTTALMLLFVYKEYKEQNFFLTHGKALAACNTAAACINILVLGGHLAAYWRNLEFIRKKDVHWALWRRRMTVMVIAEMVIQLINNVAYLAPNVMILADPCLFGNPFLVTMLSVRWTCWFMLPVISLVSSHFLAPLDDAPPSTLARKLQRFFDVFLLKTGWQDKTPRRHAIVLDLPLSVHAPKLLLWVLGVVFSAANSTAGYLFFEDSLVPPSPSASICGVSVSCDEDTLLVILRAIKFSYFIVLVVLYLLCVLYVVMALRAHTYVHYRCANILIRGQVRNRMAVFNFLALSVVMLSFVGINECNSLAIAYLGFLPMQLAGGGFVALMGWYKMPVRPRAGRMPQAWLQDFDWVEGQQRHVAREFQRNKQRVNFFCFETLMKMFYWSSLVYDVDEVEGSRFTPHFAMQLNNCREFKVQCDSRTGTKCITGWGPKVVVMAFRGTASMENVMADLKAWRDPHPPARGVLWLGSQPRVHSGFLGSWMAHEYGARLVQHVQSVIQQQDCRKTDKFFVYVTGHSLGGALATLAALDIAKQCAQLADIQVVCYTFGAPRTGNHAFAREFDGVVPHCWHVINDKDIITNIGKWICLYKRSGDRVIIGPWGDIIVRPSFVELRSRRSLQCGSGSVQRHLLTAYGKSIRQIMKSQFHGKQCNAGQQHIPLMFLNPGTKALLEDVFDLHEADMVPHVAGGSTRQARDDVHEDDEDDDRDDIMHNHGDDFPGDGHP